MTKKNYLTVVFEYELGAQLPKNITAAFADDQKYEDVIITAVSLEDEISRIEQLEQQLEEMD